MGRAPCCAKAGLNRGRWTKEEDEILTKYIEVNGTGSWRSLPNNAGLLRCGKSCRLRWVNYLRRDLKRGNISPQEDLLIIKLHSILGNRWSQIACQMSGRTDNEIKNYWNSHLSRRALVTSSSTSFVRFPAEKQTKLSPPVVPVPVPPKRKGRGRTSRAAMKKNKHLYAQSREKVILSTDLLNSNPPKEGTMIEDMSDLIMMDRENNNDVSTAGLIPRPACRHGHVQQEYYSMEEPCWDNNNNNNKNYDDFIVTDEEEAVLLEMGSHEFLMNLDFDSTEVANMEKEIIKEANNDLLLSYNNDDVVMDQNSWTWDWDLDFQFQGSGHDMGETFTWPRWSEN